ncbi:glycosyltransferase family 2 protein [Aquirufa antheringensis]|uniref:glycosyltransferase family 2 protein n=1 Tax=Aquirufa antheringensis TaxID=2516559 RepID=UPI0022A842D0|nr:glycosyltransferase family 2 protein [Aquirufa antheringensis]MCZ2486956.1 glycosyltransferase family 2 protein [Aquirufa antheringensis]
MAYYKPLVSVIIPNFNHSQFLEQRIESVLNQRFENFEVIILDDCSSDNSLQIIERYRNNPVISKIVYNETNSGSTFIQWKKGIEIASGEYIWIAESDDWCEPTFIETIYSELVKDKSISLGFAQSICLNESSSIRFVSKSENLTMVCNGTEFINNTLAYNNVIINASMAIFRKDKAIDFCDEIVNFKYCGDWLFWIKISKNNKVFISGKILNYFRKHSKDVSGNYINSGLNFKEELNVLNLLYSQKELKSEFYQKSVRNKYLNFISNYFSYSRKDREYIKYLFDETDVIKYYYFLVLISYSFTKKLLGNIKRHLLSSFIN